MRSTAKIMTLALGAVVACARSGDAQPIDERGSSPVAGTDAVPDAKTGGAPLRIVDLAYQLVPGTGPRVLVRGTRPTGTPFMLHVELLDAHGRPAAIDAGDGAPEPSVLDLEGPENVADGFFVEIQSAVGVERFVRSVAVTPRDASGRAGERRHVAIAPVISRAENESCDAQGFDLCAAELACAPGIVGGPNKCVRAAALRARRCAEAPALEVGGSTRLEGLALGASSWDPPDGCASAERRGRPEGIARLHVSALTPTLTLSTGGATTDFDTVVYVLPDCGATSAFALACNDDAPPPTSTVVLHDVAPGDYIVVVDSLAREGGSFTLHATAP